jgi:hypothetical protein
MVAPLPPQPVQVQQDPLGLGRVFRALMLEERLSAAYRFNILNSASKNNSSQHFHISLDRRQLTGPLETATQPMISFPFPRESYFNGYLSWEASCRADLPNAGSLEEHC